MKKKEWNEGLNHLDSDLVEKYVEQKDRLKQKNKKSKSTWLRFGAIAACFCLIVSTIIIVPLFQKSNLSDVPTWDTAQYSAQDVADFFERKYLSDSGATNAYTKIYVPNNKYLYINKMAEDEYLKLYQHNKEDNALSRGEFQSFIDSFLPKLAESIGAFVPQFNMEEKEYSNRSILSVRTDIGPYRISVRQNEASYAVDMVNLNGDRKIIIEGETIQIDQRISDEEITTSIQSIKNKLFDIFNVSFSDTKIIRKYGSYSEYGAELVTLYFYDASAHPLNSTQDKPISDYISITFDNISNYSGDIVSDEILEVSTINYIKYRNDIANIYTLAANVRRISIEEAEILLHNGYVFGGHSCPLCMATQDKISFSSYDFVDIEYVFGYDETKKTTVGIPFYAFYKNIGTSENGNSIYAKTYVAAIEISGYDNYFKSQKENHSNGWFNDEVG